MIRDSRVHVDIVLVTEYQLLSYYSEDINGPLFRITSCVGIYVV